MRHHVRDDGPPLGPIKSIDCLGAAGVIDGYKKCSPSGTSPIIINHRLILADVDGEPAAGGGLRHEEDRQE